MTASPDARWSVQRWLGRVRLTGLDIALGLFLVTAGVGVWTAYDRSGAWPRFWLILAGTVLSAVIARGPSTGLGAMANVASGLTAALSVYFLLTHDWNSPATDFPWLKALGVAWMGVRPDLRLPALPPNQAGGLLAFLFPLSVASTISAWRQKAELLWASVLFMPIGALGVFASSSRGAWGALAASGLVVGICWPWKRMTLRPWAGRAVRVLGIMAVVGLWWGAVASADRISRDGWTGVPETAAGESRQELARDALDLIGDFPLTGAGLGSFPGLYSRYILAVPQFYLGYAHNLYLDIALAQGPLALVVFVTVLAGGLMACAGDVAGAAAVGDDRILQAATLAGLVVLAVHGLVDDPVYEGMGVALLFLYPGMAASLHRGKRRSMPGRPNRAVWLARGRTRWQAGAAFILLGGLALALVLSRPACLSAWHANLGALWMAQHELAAWPGEGLLATEASVATQETIHQFERALHFNSSNRTAQHRLGLLHIARGEWESGISALEGALQSDPSHRGIRKLLGYAYTWNGDLQTAHELLAGIPEVEPEMEFYAWWWADRGYSVQAERAEAMRSQLSGQQG